MTSKVMIALSGVESTGKSTLAMMLAARLRTRGVLAESIREPGASMPFPVTHLDSGSIEPWAYMVTNRISKEAEMLLRPNVDVIILDRTPLDYVVYYATRYPSGDHAGTHALNYLALSWCRSRYRSVYFLKSEGTMYRRDGFRAEKNDWRDRVESPLESALQDLNGPDSTTQIFPVEGGTYRERSEFVYHHILYDLFGESRTVRAYAQVKAWFLGKGVRVAEIIPQGSNSISRFHPASDQDDIDMMLVVDGDVDYAIEVRAMYMDHKEHLENVVQANLDVLVVPKGLEAYEV